MYLLLPKVKKRVKIKCHQNILTTFFCVLICFKYYTSFSLSIQSYIINDTQYSLNDMKTRSWMMYNYNYIFVFVFSTWLGQIGCDNRTCFSCLISHVNGDYNNCAHFDPENEENVREAGDSLCTVITVSVYRVSQEKIYHKKWSF